MRGPFLVCLGSLLAAVVPLRADWLDLKDGRALRGIDLKVRGDLRSFTLESGVEVVVPRDMILRVRRSPPRETVEFRGRTVTLREMVRTLRDEDRRREREAIRELEARARGGAKAPEARRAFDARPEADRRRYLAAALARSSLPAARSLAATELGAMGGPAASVALSAAAVGDRSPAVRGRSLETLEKLGDAATGERFVPFLSSSSRELRIRAAEALCRFPSEKAVPILIERMSRVYSDFGRATTFQGTVRSYIRDYGLVSGGTGFSTVEVADPEVSTVSTGVVLDVDVRRVEVEVYARALARITGERFGPAPKRWAAWWKDRTARG